MRFLRFLVGWWGSVAAVIPPTPSSRTFTVAAENRAFTMASEGRSFFVAFENRSFTL
jgi:hypothetical protein